MPRTVLRWTLAIVSLLLAVIALTILAVALLPSGDLSRMLLAANGRMLRGIAGLCTLGIAGAWLAGILWRRGNPPLARAATVIAILVGVVGLGNALAWLQGMERRDIAFDADGVELRGTLMLPKGPSSVPAVIIVHGSAPVGRDFYAVWGRSLVRSGIAVFVYDKRGTGSSGGAVPVSNNEVEYLRQLGADASRAVDAVMREARIDRRRVGLLGLSQGGWTAPVAASLRPQVWRIALLSGPVATVNEEQAFSDVAEASNGTPAGDRAAIEAGNRAASGAAPGSFDPVPYLSTLKSEGLWLFGGRDRHVPVELSRERIERMQDAGQRFEVELYPDGDHLLLDRRTFPPAFQDEMLPRLAAWFGAARD